MKARTDPVLLWSLFPFSLHDLELGQTSSSPPFIATVSTDLPSPLCFSKRVRIDVVEHQDKACARGKPKTSPSLVSPTSGASVRPRRFAQTKTSSSPLQCPLHAS